MGYASFVVDSFTGRGVANTGADQTQLSMSAGIADAYFARACWRPTRVSTGKTILMGFSRGGIAALYSSP
jgi:dienelactone hydrolase